MNTLATDKHKKYFEIQHDAYFNIQTKQNLSYYKFFL